MIPIDRIARLAELYDRYNNALDPLSVGCRQAKKEFDELAADLHRARAPEVNFLEFRYELVRHCRAYLRQNAPQSDLTKTHDLPDGKPQVQFHNNRKGSPALRA
jgi:hypothetical protein